MAYSRLVARVGIVGVGLMCLAVACGDDDKPANGGNTTAGQGGDSGGHGGTSGGSVNKAGNGGTAGEFGKGGGNGPGGSGGKSGSGPGGAGQGGEAGGSEGGGPAAGSDAGGAGGAAGAGGAPEPKTPQCAYGCMVDEDCDVGMVDGSGSCDQATHQCALPPPLCVTDAECMPSVSQWTTTCESDMNCDMTQACVTWGDVGYCAQLPNPDCTLGVKTKLPKRGDVGEVEVCASPDPRCLGGAYCAPGCGDPNGVACGAGNGETCSKVTGTCECQEGAECSSGVCGKNGHCADCVKDDDCAPLAAYGADKCVAGTCGCSGPGVCPDAGYKNATALCQ